MPYVLHVPALLPREGEVIQGDEQGIVAAAGGLRDVAAIRWQMQGLSQALQITVVENGMWMCVYTLEVIWCRVGGRSNVVIT